MASSSPCSGVARALADRCHLMFAILFAMKILRPLCVLGPAAQFPVKWKFWRDAKFDAAPIVISGQQESGCHGGMAGTARRRGSVRAAREPPAQPCHGRCLTFSAWPSMNLCPKLLAAKARSMPCTASIEKTRLTAPLSGWQRTCRLPRFWAMSRFAFK